MKKTSARLGAGTLALATVVTGLSFGPAAANAATAAPRVVGPLVTQSTSGDFSAVQTAGEGQRVPFRGFANLAEATAAAQQWLIPAAGSQAPISPADAPSLCLMASAGVPTLVKCDGSAAQQFTRKAVANSFVSGTGLAAVSGDSFFGISYRTDNPAQMVFQASGSADVVPNLASFRDEFSATVKNVGVNARTADLEGFAVPNSTVIINDTISVPVGADGTWSYTLTGLKLGKNDIKLEQYEGDNNKTGEASVVADLAVAPITANVVFLPDTSKPLTISGTAQAGATVEIWNGATKVATAPTADVTGAYTADIPAPNAGGMQTYTVKQVLQNETAPDVKTVTADFGAQVSITEPVNDFIHNGGALRFQGRGVAGGTVELRERGKQGVIGTAPVLANGIWTLDTTIPGKKATYVAMQTGKGNNVTTASVTLNPDGDVNPPVVNPVTPGSNHLIGSGGTPGATIIVRDDKDNEIGRDTVDENGNWDVTVPVTLGPGKHDLEIVERNDDGDESDPTKVTVDFGKAVDALTPTIEVPVKDAKPTFTGTGQPGATVVIAGTRAEVARTEVNGEGEWSVQSKLELPVGEYVVTATQTTGIGVKSVDQLHFKRQADAPIAKPVTFTAPATGTSVNTKRPVFSGKGEPGADITVRGTRATVATTTVNDQGDWSVPSSVDLPNGDYTIFADQAPKNGAASSVANTTFKVAYRASADVVVETPTDTVATPVGRVTFTGKGDAGATVTISGTTAEVASGIVNGDGTFSITSTINFPAGDYRLVAKQVAQNGEMKQSPSFLIKVRG